MLMSSVSFRGKISFDVRVLQCGGAGQALGRVHPEETLYPLVCSLKKKMCTSRLHLHKRELLLGHYATVAFFQRLRTRHVGELEAEEAWVSQEHLILLAGQRTHDLWVR